MLSSLVLVLAFLSGGTNPAPPIGSGHFLSAQIVTSGDLALGYVGPAPLPIGRAAETEAAFDALLTDDDRIIGKAIQSLNAGTGTITATPPGLSEYVAEWQDAQGVTHRVRTVRGTTEPTAEWVTRHAQAVRDLQQHFPPVTP